MNKQTNLRLIENVMYEETSKSWANYRNPKDRFLVEVSYQKDGKTDRTRMTTNDLVKFTNYLELNGYRWQWMNVMLRWADLDQQILSIGQIANYTPHYPPRKAEPTKGEVERTAKNIGWKHGVSAAVMAYKRLVLSIS